MVNRLLDRMSWDELTEFVFEKVKPGLKKTEYQKFKDWFKEREKVGYRFDPSLVLRCYRIWLEMHNNLDHFIVVSGREGFGKSTLAIQLAAFIALDSFKVKHILNTTTGFLEILENRVRECDNQLPTDIKAALLDEGTELLSREALNTTNKVLVKTFFIQRALKFLTIICIPNFFMLDSVVRNHRCRTLIEVIDKGKYKAIVGKAIKYVAREGSRDKSVLGVRLQEGTFWHGYFNKEFPSTVNYNEYEQTKMQGITDVITELHHELGVKKNIKLTRAAKEAGISTQTAMRMGERGEINIRKLGGNYFIDRESYFKLTGDLQISKKP